MNEERPDLPVCYVLMRTDLIDYQPGKCMAQAHHAGTRMMTHASRAIIDHALLPDLMADWLDQGGGFGTTIVLGVTYPQLLARTALASAAGLLADLVRDPTYPVRDGHMLVTLPIDTCGYVFGLRSDCQPVVGDLKLFV